MSYLHSLSLSLTKQHVQTNLYTKSPVIEGVHILKAHKFAQTFY